MQKKIIQLENLPTTGGEENTEGNPQRSGLKYTEEEVRYLELIRSKIDD